MHMANRFQTTSQNIFLPAIFLAETFVRIFFGVSTFFARFFWMTGFILYGGASTFFRSTILAFLGEGELLCATTEVEKRLKAASENRIIKNFPIKISPEITGIRQARLAASSFSDPILGQQRSRKLRSTIFYYTPILTICQA